MVHFLLRARHGAHRRMTDSRSQPPIFRGETKSFHFINILRAVATKRGTEDFILSTDGRF